jgi:hypothetical protein
MKVEALFALAPSRPPPAPCAGKGARQVKWGLAVMLATSQAGRPQSQKKKLNQRV